MKKTLEIKTMGNDGEKRERIIKLYKMIYIIINKFINNIKIPVIINIEGNRRM
jgi:hypothetical protein